MAFSDWGGQAIGGATNILGTVLGGQAQRDALNRQADIAKQNNATALEIAKINLLASQSSANASTGTPSNKNLYIGLGIGGVVILGVIIFAVTKK